MVTAIVVVLMALAVIGIVWIRRKQRRAQRKEVEDILSKVQKQPREKSSSVVQTGSKLPRRETSERGSDNRPSGDDLFPILVVGAGLSHHHDSPGQDHRPDDWHGGGGKFGGAGATRNFDNNSEDSTDSNDGADGGDD